MTMTFEICGITATSDKSITVVSKSGASVTVPRNYRERGRLVETGFLPGRIVLPDFLGKKLCKYFEEIAMCVGVSTLGAGAVMALWG